MLLQNKDSNNSVNAQFIELQEALTIIPRALFHADMNRSLQIPLVVFPIEPKRYMNDIKVFIIAQRTCAKKRQF